MINTRLARITLSMIDYIGKIIDNIPDDTEGESTTHAAHYFFEISEDEKKLSQADADLFHNFVAQLLYLSIRAHPVIQIEVSFLCTKVRGTDTDEYNNLARVMKYIQGTIGLPLILSIDKSGNIKWYVYAAFELHKDMRSHTGGLMKMGTGGPM